VYDNIPRPVVGSEIGRIPPILIKHSIRKAKHLGKSVEPGMEKKIETAEEN